MAPYQEVVGADNNTNILYDKEVLAQETKTEDKIICMFVLLVVTTFVRGGRFTTILDEI